MAFFRGEDVTFIQVVQPSVVGLVHEKEGAPLIAGTLLWFIWSFRNRLAFSNPSPKKAVFWDNIVSQSFLWISSKYSKSKFSWVGWLQNLLATVASFYLFFSSFC